MNAAAALAKCTGSTNVVIIRETRHLDGTLTVDSIENSKEYTGCPETTNGHHSIQWVVRPPMSHNGVEVSGEELRGMCDFCGEIFVEHS